MPSTPFHDPLDRHRAHQTAEDAMRDTVPATTGSAITVSSTGSITFSSPGSINTGTAAPPIRAGDRGQPVTGPMARICAWCVPMHEMSPGTLPATHGICPPAAARLLEQIHARPLPPALVACSRCQAHRDLALAPRCFVCGAESAVALAVPPTDRDLATEALIAAAEQVDRILWDYHAIGETHPAAEDLRYACREYARSREGDL